MSLLAKITALEKTAEFAARLRKSPFTLVDEVDYEPDTPASRPPPPPVNDAGRSARITLSAADVAHLTFAHRHEMPVHRMEVAALLEAFENDHNTAHLHRAVAMLEHLIELSE